MDAKRERHLDEAVWVLRRRKGVKARQCHAPTAASSAKSGHYSMENLLSFVRGKKKKGRSLETTCRRNGHSTHSIHGPGTSTSSA
jgi:hypothetical protein